MKTCVNFIIYHSFLLRMINVANKICREYQNTHFVMSNCLENRTIYEKMWKKIVEWNRPQMTKRRMHTACWIPKATNTHTLRMCNIYCFSTATIVA
jgi:hypothetical protein